MCVQKNISGHIDLYIDIEMYKVCCPLMEKQRLLRCLSSARIGHMESSHDHSHLDGLSSSPSLGFQPVASPRSPQPIDAESPQQRGRTSLFGFARAIETPSARTVAN